MKKQTYLYIIGASILALAVVVGLSTKSPLEWSQVKADQTDAYSESFMANLAPATDLATTTTTVASSTATSTTNSQVVFNVRKDGSAIDYAVTLANSATAGSLELYCTNFNATGSTSSAPVIASSATTTSGSIAESDINAAAINCNPNIQTLSHLAQAMREGSINVSVTQDNGPTLYGTLSRSDTVLPLLGFEATTTTPIATSTATSTSTTTSTTTGMTGETGTTTATSTVTATSTATTSEQSGTEGSSTATVSPSGWYYVFVSPDSYYKVPGSTVVFNGSHFAPNENVTIASNGSTVSSISANSSGNFTTGSITVPYESGRQTYTFTGSTSGISFPVGLTIGPASPWITLSTYYAGAGAPLTVSGHAFGSNEQVTVSFNGSTLGTAQTDGQGNFTLNAVVPTDGSGQRTVMATGASSGVSDTESFSQAF